MCIFALTPHVFSKDLTKGMSSRLVTDQISFLLPGTKNNLIFDLVPMNQVQPSGIDFSTKEKEIDLVVNRCFQSIPIHKVCFFLGE